MGIGQAAVSQRSGRRPDGARCRRGARPARRGQASRGRPGHGGRCVRPWASGNRRSGDGMTDVDDGYGSYYAERLWQLLPAVYRTADTDSLVGAAARCGSSSTASATRWRSCGAASTSCGPTSRSRPARTGSSRTSATCSAPTSSTTSTRAAQRLDVAKTIHYRRRKGTLQVLEELAVDVTGWTARGRRGVPAPGAHPSRLDPAVGAAASPASPADVAALLQAEGLTGLLTGTPAGGCADLRSRTAPPSPAARSTSSSTAPTCVAGREPSAISASPSSWCSLWRLRSFPVVGATPVAVAGCGRPVRVRPDRAADSRCSCPRHRPFDDFSAVLDARPGMAGARPADRSLDAALSASRRRGTALPPAPAYPDPTPPTRYAVDGAPLAAGVARARPLRRPHRPRRRRSPSTTSTASPPRSAPAPTTATCSATRRRSVGPSRRSRAAADSTRRSPRSAPPAP